MNNVTGLETVLKNISEVAQEVVDRVTKATEITSVLVANNAKDKHDKGLAHAIFRYENQTTNLTNSIMPRLIQSDKNAVVSVIFTDKEYAPKVELGSSKTHAYPFMHPALMSQEKEFKQRIEKAIHGNT
jgi:HK97 gp10 family phage protein